jgi:AcrR family transcriptional regulator
LFGIPDKNIFEPLVDIPSRGRHPKERAVCPKLVDKTEKSNGIAAAAICLFAEQGYAATRVGQIAEAAGIGKGTIYQYFSSKEEIFVYTINNWIMNLLNRMLEGIRDLEDPSARLETVIQMVKEVLNAGGPDPKKLFADIDQQTFMPGGAFYKRRHIIKNMRSAFCDMVTDILLDGVSKKVFKPEIARDAAKISINLLAYLEGIGMHYLIMEDYGVFEEQIDFYIREFITAIRS